MGNGNGLVLDVLGAQTTLGTRVDIATAVPGAANQEWQLVQLPYYEIISRATGMVLEVYGAQTYNGAPVDIYNTVAAAPNQQWKLVSVGGNSYQLVGNRSGKVLDVANAQTAQGTPVDIAFAVPGASNQTWQLAPVDGQYYQIVSTASGKVLDVVGAGTAPGTRIDIATAVPGAFNQEWQFVELPYFQIVSKASGQVLDVYAAQTNQGTPVDIAPAVAGAPNQEWMLVPSGTPLPPAVFTVSGQVTSGGAGISGVVVTLSGSQSVSTITDASGNYSFNVVAGGSYTVTPSMPGYTFSPASATFSNLNTNQIATFSVVSGTEPGLPISDPPSGPAPTPTPPVVVSGSAVNCNDISGQWTDSISDTFSLSQAGSFVSGTTTQPDPSCGAVTWTITGQVTGTGTFALTEFNPTPAVDACGRTVQSGQTANVVISSCSTAEETETGAGGASFAGGGSGASGSSNTWTRTSNPPGIQVAVDLMNDKVSTTLTGQNKTGNLSIKINGPTQTTLAQHNSAQTGNSFNDSLQRTSLAIGQYGSVVASWDDITLSVPVSFNVLGSTRFSTYNVPTENACFGSSTPIYIFENDASACLFYSGSIMSDFSTATNLNGTGLSIDYGLIKPWGTTRLSKFCPVPPLPGATKNNTYVRVGSVVSDTTGSCNTKLAFGSSVATNPYPNTSNTWKCSDGVLLVNSSNQTDSIKVVGDACPACGDAGDFRGQNGHIDVFSSYAACGGHSATDYGNFTAIRLT